ncbi:acyl-[acyl-carrier-protein] thioesterase [Fodinibius saliphilus]|uniref:acyl-[acyl-carrier-protein] thioesterase n=1 Tax=Fodinibius saliphilus TaxID=1920650 RepID=UPI001108EED5|nr:acyl-ACP thioesterase domain-containing protein [Fodinibius saliphilus]
MDTEKLSYKESFKIRASEVASNHQATLPAIGNLLQEIAGNHARKLSFDITDLQENNRTWVLHRLHIQMERLPDWRETICIQTWPSGGDGLRAHRDFLILDNKETIIGRALSYWLILDIESRRPTRIPEEILKKVPTNSDHVLQQNEFPSQPIESPVSKKYFTVRKSDLDLNNHVNNVRFVEWMFSCLPDSTPIKNIDIVFKAESTYGDKIIARQMNTDEHTYLQVVTEPTNKILAEAVI